MNTEDIIRDCSYKSRSGEYITGVQATVGACTYYAYGRNQTEARASLRTKLMELYAETGEIIELLQE